MPAVTLVSKPAQGGSTQDFIASDWRPFEKNTLRAFLSLTLPSGLVLRNCTFHQKGDARWIGLPAQKFTKDDGSTSYVPLVEFTSKEARDRFNTAALRAVDRALGGQQ